MTAPRAAQTLGVDQAGHLPTFISVTDGKTGDVTVARTWTFPAGSVVVADRACLDFGWLHQLQQRGVTFVTRLSGTCAIRWCVSTTSTSGPGC